jgi:hypothetical protein
MGMGAVVRIDERKGDEMKGNPTEMDLLVTACVICWAIGMACGSFISFHVAETYFERAAIKSGQAEYVVGERGEAVWRMKEASDE